MSKSTRKITNAEFSKDSPNSTVELWVQLEGDDYMVHMSNLNYAFTDESQIPFSIDLIIGYTYEDSLDFVLTMIE